jgi:hypothetical protein
MKDQNSISPSVESNREACFEARVKWTIASGS